jgi:hypothetical protein
MPIPEAAERLGWTGEEYAMIYSARDQIRQERGCDCSRTSMGFTSLSDPCSCLESAARRVAADLMETDAHDR